jgi:exopolysaccharide production protein ExoQ
MPPNVVLLLWFVLLLALFCFDPAREPRVSAALWLPTTWMFILASRAPSMWLSGHSAGLSAATAAQALEQGNPTDRTILSLFTLLAFAILVSRSFQWGNFVSQNSALVLFLGFTLLSVAWSDFPEATFKKWFRDMGVYMAVLVVASDPRPLEAVRTVLRRVCYLAIPLSLVLIKYFPYLGQKFSPWGSREYTGVATSKNMLGALCLVSGIFFFWDTAARWHQRSEACVRRAILLNIAFFGMSVWLLNSYAHSDTSGVCLAIGCLVIAAAHSNLGRRHVSWVKALAPMMFVFYLILTFGFGLGGELSQAVGRSADMSDRTHIWQAVLSVHTNPLIGTGYQSFWLGWRVLWVWARLNGDNVLEAHNGYLETYLELGVIGLFLVCAFLIATYRKVCRRLEPLTPLGTLGLGLWTLLLFYNVTEAALGGGQLWLILIMASVTIPQRAGDQAHASAPLALGTMEQASDLSFETAGPWS